MTVVTHSLSEKKLQKEPLVQAASGAEEAAAAAAVGRDGRVQTLVRVVRDRLQPVRQRGPLASSCVFLSAFLLFCAGMAACGYVYQQYQVYQVSAR